MREGYFDPSSHSGRFTPSQGYIIYNNNKAKLFFYNWVDSTKYDVEDIPGASTNSGRYGKSVYLPFSIQRVISMKISRVDWTQPADFSCMYSPKLNRIDIFNNSKETNDGWAGFSLEVDVIL